MHLNINITQKSFVQTGIVGFAERQSRAMEIPCATCTNPAQLVSWKSSIIITVQKAPYACSESVNFYDICCIVPEKAPSPSSPFCSFFSENLMALSFNQKCSTLTSSQKQQLAYTVDDLFFKEHSLESLKFTVMSTC